MRVLAVIMARGGSTRLPGKNLALLGQAPLVRHATAAAQAADCITRTYVSTDSKEIAEAAGCEWIKRPAELSGPAATIEQAAAHALLKAEAQARAEHQARPEYDYVVTLQAAAPIRPPGAIDALVKVVSGTKAQGGVTAVKRSPWIWNVYPHRADGIPASAATTWWNPKHYPRSQDVPQKTLEEINSIQVTPRNLVIAHRRHAAPLCLLELPAWCDHDVDTAEDLARLRASWDTIQPQLLNYAGQGFMYYFVHPTQRPPTLRFPLQTPWAEGLAGVILGNGPDIDRIPPETWRALDHAKGLITLGLNRICCADACTNANFAPTLHLIWDKWPDDSRPFVNAGLARLAGRTWRISGPDSAAVLQNDQAIAKSLDPYGPPTELKMRHGSADGAANLLYRLGCRQIYFLGVEMNNGQRCSVPWTEGPGSTGAEGWQVSQLQALRDVSIYPGVKMACMSPDSKLITSGLMDYAWPAEVKDPLKDAAVAAS